ncbi:hypothetical protein [Tumebacillus avium]|nr:hypothetical protein [Tumebacillus avium]
MKKQLATGLLVVAVGFAFLFTAVEKNQTIVADTIPPIPFSVVNGL